MLLQKKGVRSHFHISIQSFPIKLYLSHVQNHLLKIQHHILSRSLFLFPTDLRLSEAFLSCTPDKSVILLNITRVFIGSGGCLTMKTTIPIPMIPCYVFCCYSSDWETPRGRNVILFVWRSPFHYMDTNIPLFIRMRPSKNENASC